MDFVFFHLIYLDNITVDNHRNFDNLWSIYHTRGISKYTAWAPGYDFTTLPTQPTPYAEHWKDILDILIFGRWSNAVFILTELLN